MGMEVVGDGDLVVLPGRCDEPNAEGLTRAAQPCCIAQGPLRWAGDRWGG